jgi:hypothetical protein
MFRLQDVLDQIARLLVHFLFERSQDQSAEEAGRGLGLFLRHLVGHLLPMVQCKSDVLPGE